MADEQQLLDLIAHSQQGVLAAVTGAGYPHLTNVLYVWDPEERTARVSTTADRVKARIARRDPVRHCTLLDRTSSLTRLPSVMLRSSEVASTPGDEACRELLQVPSAFYGEQDDTVFFQQMIDARRLVIRLRVRRLYGVVLAEPPGNPIP